MVLSSNKAVDQLQRPVKGRNICSHQHSEGSRCDDGRGLDKRAGELRCLRAGDRR